MMENNKTIEQRVKRLEDEFSYLKWQNNILMHKDDKEFICEVKSRLINEKENWDKDNSAFKAGKIKKIEEQLKFLEQFMN